MSQTVVTNFKLSAFTVPTKTAEESDGTFTWSSTTMVLVELEAGGIWGLGYTYGPSWLRSACKTLIDECVKGRDPQDIEARWNEMVAAVRNYGKVGPSAMAISAIDIALWDLKAKLLKTSLTNLLGAVRTATEVYGSGGFTSYTTQELERQMIEWKEQGLRKFKMKIGRDPAEDVSRVRVVRECVGKDSSVYVDANEAYDVTTSLKMADEFAKNQVTWFEQPISAFDLEGMSYLRPRLPKGMRLTDGEYIFDTSQTRDLLKGRCVDVLQLDATRCKGFTGFLKSAALAQAYNVPTSSHCAPSLHLPVANHTDGFREIEYFFDHVRIESLFFDGTPSLQRSGFLQADLSRPGLGLELKVKDAEKYAV